MNLEGKLLGNRYEIIEKIGNGGMATVYKAKCLVLKRYVAVKILRDEFTTDNEFIKRFNIEAESAASLTHPNIVSVYDVGHEGNLYYIVMELVKGKTLKEIIIEDGILGWKWSIKVAMQIASALETAHKNNIIHRDIKPHNIIITEDGTAKVTDFGIAKAVSNSTITAFGTTIGSVHYFSPEHAKGGYTDAKSDLYSLGVVLYEMVTGRVPFDADTPVSVALKHMQENPVEPIEINPNLPKSLNKIIMKAMQKDPNLRYQTATEMIRDLEMSLKDTEGNFVGENLESNFETRRVSLNYGEKDINKNVKNKEKSKFKAFFEKHKVIKWLCIMLTFALIFIASLIVALYTMKTKEAKDVQIPNFVGMTLEQATAEASKISIIVENEEEGKYDATAPKGQILSQKPIYQENYNIKEGSIVKVVTSLGQEMVTMPKIIGKTKDEATNELKKAKLEFEVEEKYDDKIEKNIVIEQSVAENEEILAGTKIKITISKGTEQVEVPDLSELTEESAKQALTNAKLKWKSTTKVSDSSKTNGVVVGQSESPHSMVNKDTEITITINEFEEIKEATITINVKSLTGYTTKYEKDELGNNVSIDPEDVSLKLIVGSDTWLDEKVKKDSTGITKIVTGTGTQAVKVKINEVTMFNGSINFNTQSSLTIE